MGAGRRARGTLWIVGESRAPLSGALLPRWRYPYGAHPHLQGGWRGPRLRRERTGRFGGKNLSFDRAVAPKGQIPAGKNGRGGTVGAEPRRPKKETGEIQVT